MKNTSPKKLYSITLKEPWQLLVQTLEVLDSGHSLTIAPGTSYHKRLRRMVKFFAESES